MSKLRTLGEIVTYMDASAPTASGAALNAPSAPKVDLHSLMLEVISEKTGYPVEMLGLEMDLEADLGVDSIKRVEILSAMRERGARAAGGGRGRDVEAADAGRDRHVYGWRFVRARPRSPLWYRARPPGSRPNPRKPSGATPSSSWKAPPRGSRCPASSRRGAWRSRAAVRSLATPSPRLSEALASRRTDSTAHSRMTWMGSSSSAASRPRRPRLMVRSRSSGRRSRWSGASLPSSHRSAPSFVISVQDTGGDFGRAGSERGLGRWPAGVGQDGRARVVRHRHPRDRSGARRRRRDARRATSRPRAAPRCGGGRSRDRAAGRRWTLRARDRARRATRGGAADAG